MSDGVKSWLGEVETDEKLCKEKLVLLKSIDIPELIELRNDKELSKYIKLVNKFDRYKRLQRETQSTLYKLRQLAGKDKELYEEINDVSKVINGR
jgi:hypothetical protein